MDAIKITAPAEADRGSGDPAVAGQGLCPEQQAPGLASPPGDCFPAACSVCPPLGWGGGELSRPRAQVGSCSHPSPLAARGWAKAFRSLSRPARPKGAKRAPGPGHAEVQQWEAGGESGWATAGWRAGGLVAGTLQDSQIGPLVGPPSFPEASSGRSSPATS